MIPKYLAPCVAHDAESAKEIEADPTGRLPHTPGAKLDAGKAPIHRGLLSYFPRACAAVARVSQYGAKKYTWRGWETVPDGVQRYSDAGARHVMAEALGERYDPDSGELHQAHVAWNALAVLELKLKEKE